MDALAVPTGLWSANENTVATWLGTRERIATLYLQIIQIDQEEETGFDFHKRPTRKAIKRRQKRIRNLERLYDAAVAQLEIDVQTDLELGTRMGAAYCVTGATGHLPDGVIDPED